MPNNIAGSSDVLQMHSSLMSTNGIIQLSSLDRPFAEVQEGSCIIEMPHRLASDIFVSITKGHIGSFHTNGCARREQTCQPWSKLRAHLDPTSKLVDLSRACIPPKVQPPQRLLACHAMPVFCVGPKSGGP